MIKKAQTTVPIFTLITVAFVFAIILGTFAYFFGIVNSSFDNNLIAGQVNVTNASAQTVGLINNAFLDSADLLGIFFLFGVVFSILIAGFMMRDSTSKLFFMIDFFLIIFGYILAVYVSNSYETVLAVLPFSDLIIANVGNTSKFVLLLPQITVVTGFITMILTYSGIPKLKSGPEVAGF